MLFNSLLLIGAKRLLFNKQKRLTNKLQSWNHFNLTVYVFCIGALVRRG